MDIFLKDYSFGLLIVGDLSWTIDTIFMRHIHDPSIQSYFTLALFIMWSCYFGVVAQDRPFHDT